MTSNHSSFPGQTSNSSEPQHEKMLRYATRMTLVLAVASAVSLPLLPSLTQASSSRHQQLAQAAADRVAAGGGMLWLDDDEANAASTAE